MSNSSVAVEDDRTGLSPETLRRAVLDHLRYTQAKSLTTATALDVYHALAHTARDRLVHRWIETQRTYAEHDVKRVYYLSAEYLLGRQLEANLLSLGLYDVAAEGLAAYDIDLLDVFEQEPDPGLGNGGLGRLAACFMDSLANLELPGMGYGIRYEFGIFRQEIERGWQVEQPDEWLRNGNPWEISRPEYTVPVRFGGYVEQWVDADGRFQAEWIPEEVVLGVPYDTPVAGFRNNTVNTLRLWAARASEEFDLQVFNDGDYRRAVEQKALSESISKVLYPKDTTPEGKALRLRQQYFFVACSLHDLIRRHKARHKTLEGLADKAAVQLNDTHPAIAVAELMRLLVDREKLEWDDAWRITRATIAYTNHTLLPEALETWPEDLIAELLPRHLQIIREIDRRFRREVHVFDPSDHARPHRMGIVEQGQVRMAHLSVAGSHTVNGVAELHSQLLKDRVLREFAEIWPDRFTNVTNGVTPRRWLLQCNRPLSDAITTRVGRAWVTDLTQLTQLEPLVDDSGFLAEIRDIKHGNKRRLEGWLKQHCDIALDPAAIFDVQIKRIHEYKRQLLCVLHAVHLYNRIKFHGETIVPRAIMLGGKAAPGYTRAKQIIKLVSDVSAILNADPATRGQLSLHFLPNYNVSMSEKVIPATDLSEQISMAGKEASGTGNMKFQMNGALTIGTLDGANIEIREEVGPENFFLFGLDAAEVRARRAAGYDPGVTADGSEALSEVLALLDDGCFEPDRPTLHRELVRYLRHDDPFMVCADFDDYLRAQREAAGAFVDEARWWPMVARNIARAGKFSSDRTIQDYASRIWGIEPCTTVMPKS